jgi:membrane associated rhomboid family serine protease
MEHKLTWSLIIINVMVFELIFSMPEPLFNLTFEMLDFSFPNALQLWRWFTSMFLHANASHLFLNMLALYFFGRVLEDELSSRQWISIYFISGLVGNLFYGLTSVMPAVGASGCIFGLLGAAMLLKPKELIRIYVFPLPLGFIAVLYILTQVALAALPVETVGIAYMAHIGGLITGSLLMFYFNPKDAFRGLFWMIMCLGILLILGPIIGLVVFIGEIILGFFEAVVGIALYGVAQFLLSWIWTLFL